MAERNNRAYNSSDDEEDEESEEESDSSDNTSSDSSLSSSSSSSATPSHRQNQSSSEETSDNAEELCPAARLLVCNRRHQTVTSVHKKNTSRKKSPPRKSSQERKSSKHRRSSTVSNAGTQTAELIESEVETNNQNNCSQEVDRRRKKSESKKSKSRKHKVYKSEFSYSPPKQNFQAQTEDFGIQVTEVSEAHNSHIEDRQRRKSSKTGKMNSLFMQEKPIEEEDEDDVRNPEDDRPIRGMSSLTVREDTMDGAEAPDHDPPQRRRTLEDISITELTAQKTVLPPEYPEDESPPTLLPCVTCGRTFNPSALDRHRKVCQKIASTGKKKQVFNAHTQRFEVEDGAGGNGGRACTPERTFRGESPTPQKKKKHSRWREKHQEFLRTIRAARSAPEGDADAGAPGSSVPSDYVQCPVCGRHFGPKAADRHIDWCKEQSTRLRSNSADVQLVERLKSRTKYVPPKPGQGGWRAPKKTDVISSIPPPSASSTDRRISPPPIAPPRRGVSPSPLAQRRGVSPSPLSRQHSTASLGRSTARSVSSILQAVTGNYSSPYGQRHATQGSNSGYATPSSYSAYGGQGPRTPSLTRSGSFSGSGGPQNFVRSASLRVPSSRRTSGERKARTRDLASDMLASVCLGSSPARGEPEGDEAEDFSSRETTLSPPPFTKSHLDSPFDLDFDSPKYGEEKYNCHKYDSGKKDSSLESYDPYSAAEMQMQALLGPSFGSEVKDEGSRGTGLSAAGMGVGELGSYEREQPNFRKHSTSPPPKDRLASLKIPSSPGLTRSYRQTSPLSSITQDGISPTPSGEFFNEKRFWRRSPSPPTSRGRWSSSPKSPSHTGSPTRRSPGREDRLSITSLSGTSQDSNRCVTSASNTSKLFPRDSGVSDGTFSTQNDTPGGLHSEERFSSGSLRDNRFGAGAARDNRALINSRTDRFGTDSSSTEGTFVRGNRFGSFGSGTSRLRLATGMTSSPRETRYSGSGASAVGQRSEGNGAADVPEANKSGREDTSARSSLKALRLALGGERRGSPLETSPKHARKSSPSSSDSSLPPLTSSGSSLSPTTPSKAVREDAVGGHSSLITPRLVPPSPEGRHSSTALSFDNSTLSNISPSETLQDVISSLTALGSGSSLTNRYSSFNSDSSKPSTFSEPKLSKYSNLNDFRKSSSTDSKTITPLNGNAPKFCYECGNKYPVTMAKFCCHCGSRRATVN